MVIHDDIHERPRSAIRTLLKSEAAGGIVLMVSAAVALLVANSPLAPAYFSALHAPFAGLDVLHWINDGLMAIFFLLVGLEIKREMLDGQLATWSRRALPGIGAVGGMAVPAVIYVAFNVSSPELLRGWAIPAATDIAFALGVLALLGKRVPVSLKVFLAALAIIDDLGAVLIIAVFYTADLNVLALGAAAVIFAALVAMNRLRVYQLWPYLLLGLPLWGAVFLSGVHATIAGVLLALTIPLRESPARPDDRESLVHRLEHAIAPWSAFLIVPVFGFANAGVSFAGVTSATLLGSVPLGIAAGLFFGKQIGVFAFCWVAIRTKLADLPAYASWRQLYGVALLCGIGFTMSLFIGLLAFDVPSVQDAVKLGVLAGSIASGLAGWLLLRTSTQEAQAAERKSE